MKKKYLHLMSQSTNNQPVLSRSAKILFIGLAQFFIMGIVMSNVATSIMETIDNSESTDFVVMDFLSSNMDMLIYLMIGMLFFVTGSITLIVSGIMYLSHKRKGIKFVTPKNEPVNIKRQTIYAIIPILDMYAAIKIKKFWVYTLIMLGIGLITIPLDELEIFPQTFPENVLIQEAIILPIAIVVIRIFSKKWNEKVKSGFSEEISETTTEISETIEEIPRLYVESRWKKPNIYFTIPSIYLFISTGILVLGTIVKINDDYFLLSITYSLHLIILSIPSVIGAIQLWHRKKIGLIFSNISLILLSLVMPTSIFSIIQYLPISDLDFLSGETGVIFGSSIGLSILMMWFLSIAKKHVQWNKQFSENSIDTETK